jgi:catalase
MDTTNIASQPGPVAMIDALNNTFGKHAGKRASHAKGFCAHGEFLPSPDAARLVDGPLFRAEALAATLRFSVGGGNPGVSDKSRSVRGMAVRVSHGERHWDLVLLSEPVFFAATPESFVSFLAARVADPVTKKPDPAKVAAHNARFPDGTRQPALLASHGAPASYATTPYFSNNAFTFKSAAGAMQTARIVVQPLAGTRHLSDEDEIAYPDTFLEEELALRTHAAPVEFDVLAQLPAEGDSLTDPSQPWLGAGTVKLGRLRVKTVAAPDACDGLVFVPVNLPDGIGLSDDPILLSRAAAYAVSLKRRTS